MVLWPCGWRRRIEGPNGSRHVEAGALGRARSLGRGRIEIRSISVADNGFGNGRQSCAQVTAHVSAGLKMMEIDKATKRYIAAGPTWLTIFSW